MRTLTLLIATMLSFTVCYAQTAKPVKKEIKFGKPDISLVQMQRHPKDSTASAAILHEEMNVYYKLTSSAEIWQYTDITKRIKVLSSDGSKYADVNITLYSPGSHRTVAERIDACAMNIEDGKVVKSVIKKDLIFREKLGEDATSVKFTIPNVKVGTVIDYSYTVKSSMLTDIPTHVFQHEIPCDYSKVEYRIPDFLIFNVDLTNSVNIATEKSQSAETYRIGNGSTILRENIVEAAAVDIPAIRMEPHVWNHLNYISKISLELLATQFPGDYYRKITSTWESVNEILKKSKFSDHIRMSNPLKEETAAAIANASEEQEKIKAILKLLHTRIKWDGNYSLVSSSPKAALSKGSGNSADINCILNSMLAGAGFKTQFMLLNPNRYTKLVKPTLDHINHFIIQVTLSNGETCYVDGTSVYSDINILPPEIMVDRAHMYGDNSYEFTDLTRLTKNIQRTTATGTLTPDGQLQLNIKETYRNMDAFMENIAMDKYNSEDEYLEKLEDELQSEISEYTTNRSNTQIERSYQYTKSPNSTDGYIYLDALLSTALTKNPFSATERKFPIEFKYGTTKQIAYSIKLPEGYTVEDLPASIAAQACKGGMTARFTVSYTGETLTGSLTFNMDRISYAATEYAELQKFFDVLTELSNKQIIIRRNSQEP